MRDDARVSLTQLQRVITAVEFMVNRLAADLMPEDVCDLTGLGVVRFHAAYEVRRGARPADVWLVADTLQSAVRRAGVAPTPYTVLTEASRAAATGWFGVPKRPAPDR